MKYRRLRIPGATYFFTVVAHKRAPLFSDPEAVAALLTVIETVRGRRPFETPAYVILPDHLHALWTLPDGDDDFPTRWRLIKNAFTRWQVARHGGGKRSDSRAAKGEQAVWQRRYWEHAIRGDDDFNRCFDYIHFNPVRHGLAAAPRDWPHSTFMHWVAQGRYDIGWGSDRADEIAAWRDVGHIWEP